MGVKKGKGHHYYSEKHSSVQVKIKSFWPLRQRKNFEMYVSTFLVRSEVTIALVFLLQWKHVMSGQSHQSTMQHMRSTVLCQRMLPQHHHRSDRSSLCLTMWMWRIHVMWDTVCRIITTMWLAANMSQYRGNSAMDQFMLLWLLKLSGQALRA